MFVVKLLESKTSAMEMVEEATIAGIVLARAIQTHEAYWICLFYYLCVLNAMSSHRIGMGV